MCEELQKLIGSHFDFGDMCSYVNVYKDGVYFCVDGDSRESCISVFLEHIKTIQDYNQLKKLLTGNNE